MVPDVQTGAGHPAAVTDNSLREVRSLNLAYLITARQMLRENYPLAQFRLKLDDGVAHALMALPVAKLEALADVTQFVVRFAFTDPERLRTLIADQPEDGMVAMHAAVALTGIGATPGMAA